MFSIGFVLIAIDECAVKIRIECVTAHRAAVPLNKNGS